jgi:hypothetical protein
MHREAGGGREAVGPADKQAGLPVDWELTGPEGLHWFG